MYTLVDRTLCCVYSSVYPQTTQETTESHMHIHKVESDITQGNEIASLKLELSRAQKIMEMSKV